VRRYLLYFIALVSCSKDPSLWTIDNLNGNKITVMGHGGMGNKSLLPMDSYASLKKSLTTGAAGTEMDVRMTTDSVLVLFHDDETEVMTTCSGLVRNSRWSDLQDCRYTPKILNDGRIIRLTDFLGSVNDLHRFTFSFECKIRLEDPPGYYRTFARQLVAIVHQYGLTDIVIESFHAGFLAFLHEQEPDLKLFIYADDIGTGLMIHEFLPVYGIIVDMRNTDASQIKRAHARGVRVSIFNVSSEKDNISAIRMSPDFVQTDELVNMVDLLN
jgi:glycerophosphoryl diester phosphodiesterase